MAPKKIRWDQLKYHWEIYLFVVPTVILIALYLVFVNMTAIVMTAALWFVGLALVFGYLFKQKPQVATDTAPEPVVEATIVHHDAGSTGTTGADD